MSRIVQSETPGNKRTKIFKLWVNLMPTIQQSNITAKERNDVIAFIVLSLKEVEKTLEDTIRPWEKRGYWSKADQFRLEWEWVGKVNDQIIDAESPNGWGQWPEALATLYAHIADVKPTRKKMGNFWEGSYKLYKLQIAK